MTQNRVGAVIAAALVLVAACGDDGKTTSGQGRTTMNPPATPTASAAAAATPGTSITAPTPQERLHASLLAARFTAGVLPVPFADAVPTTGQGDDYDRQQNVVGVVEVPVRGPDVSNGIVYAVFPSTANAQARLAQPGVSGLGMGASFVPEGFAVPVRCTTGVTAGRTPTGVTICSAVVESVVVSGLSETASSQPSTGDTENALVLLRAGIAHLETLQPR